MYKDTKKILFVQMHLTTIIWKFSMQPDDYCIEGFFNLFTLANNQICVHKKVYIFIEFIKNV